MYIANETKYTKIKLYCFKHVLEFTSSHTPIKKVAVPSFSAEIFASHEVFSCSNLV